ncbi:hypothetical protein Pcinc_009190 [Petrolisthes cinctipes]|uniref:Uncharacterized protein n=1 Tax=Petrolisthes cinctipes TaxID=88211 RepID=A0AAE1KWK5_PETCI|nr:hypothetical protein Pcinc_010269 [Petrolisthes cinctipes]KAK3886673.1 hypothetical protein Pcinc_009190 [Petrolisthes cinctipes]
MPSPFMLLGIVLLTTFASSSSSRSSSISNLSPDDVTEEGSEEIHHFPNILEGEMKLWKEISSEPRKQLRENIYYSSEVYSMSEGELYLGKRQIRKHMEDLIRTKDSPYGKMVEMYGTVETEEGIIMEEEKQNATCNVGQWLCNDTNQCIPYDGVCNDTADCWDKSDETVELCGK